MERIRVHLSTVSASIGIVSLRWMPGILLLIGLNSPRTLDGASGLGSQMSMCDGPPCRNRTITDFADPNPVEPAYRLDPSEARAWSWRRNTSWRVTPNSPKEPIFMNSRLDDPSQNRARWRLGMVSMAIPSYQL